MMLDEKALRVLSGRTRPMEANMTNYREFADLPSFRAHV